MPADLTYDRVYPGGWENEPTETTPTSAEAFEHMEDGIAAASDRAGVSVRFDADQGLAAPEKLQALRNVGAIATVNGDGPDGFGNVNVAEFGVAIASVPTGGTDTALLQTELTAAVLASKIYRLRAGFTYRAHGVTVPTGAVIDATGATVKVPDAVTADNIFEGSGAWTLIGGVFDGNKAATTDPGATTSGNGVYQFGAAGWSGKVRLLNGPVFRNFQRSAVNAETNTASLVDAVNAPASAIYLDRVEASGCGGIALRFTGINGLEMVAPSSHDNTLHGVRTYLCKRVTVTRADCRDNDDHGFTSLYCYDQQVDGIFEDNGTDGLVFGGDASSPTIAPGRYIRVPSATCRRNSNHGLVLDASISGTDDAVPVHAWIGSVISEGNTNEGVIVTSSQYVTIVDAKTHDNGGHGVEFACADATLLSHDATGNGQKPLALEAGTNWGGHKIGMMRYSSNTPDDTLVYDPADFTANPCTFLSASTDPDGSVPGTITPDEHILIAWAYDPVVASANTIPTAGTLQLVEVKVPVAKTITKLAVYVVTGGVTLVNGFLALYDKNRNLLGVTANRATAWQTAGLDIPALVTPVDVEPGEYYVGFWWTGTTGPAFARINTNSTLINANLGASAARFATSSTGLTTTPPNPAGTLSKSGVAYWAALA